MSYLASGKLGGFRNWKSGWEDKNSEVLSKVTSTNYITTDLLKIETILTF